MNYHARKKLRDAVRGGLDAAKPPGVLGVYETKTRALVSKKLPALVVWVESENAELLAKSGTKDDPDNMTHERQVTLQVIALAPADAADDPGESLLDTLEAIALDVESRMPQLLRKWVSDYEPPETSFEEIDDETANRQFVGMVLEFLIPYETTQSDLSSPASV